MKPAPPDAVTAVPETDLWFFLSPVIDPGHLTRPPGRRQCPGKFPGSPMTASISQPAASAAGNATPASAPASFYNDKVVNQFAIATVFWGIVGMAVGVFIAAQLYWPALNFDTSWLSYGRLRPLHTNGVLFAFGGSVLFATSLYVV